MNTGELADRYRDYLRCLNDRRWDELDDFVAEDVVYNQRALGLDDYRGMLQSNVDAIPDLVFTPGLLLAQGDMIACRLEFDCTPVAPILGFEPDRSRVSFAEHVFYAFRDGKIARIWSLIEPVGGDRAARA